MQVQRTVASVFDYQQTFDEQMILIASNEPIRITQKSLTRLENERGVLATQVRSQRPTRPGDRRGQFLARVDRPTARVVKRRYIITDDHPLVEYVWASNRLVGVR